MNWKKLGLFLGGTLFGTAGISALSSDDAKKLYTHCTAAALRVKDDVMKTVTAVRENCGDIHADARDINEKRAAEKDAKELARAKAIIEAHEAKAEAQAEAAKAEAEPAAEPEA